MSASIRLGDNVINLPEKANLGEIKRVSGIMMRRLPTDHEAFEMAGFDQAFEVIVAAAKRENPDLTVQKVEEMSASVPELWTARDTILRHLGLIQEKPKVGEEVAGAEQAGSGSTESSAPASA